MSGRSLTDFERVYIDGYDMSGYLFDAGEQGIEASENESKCFSDLGTGVLCGKLRPVFGPLQGVFDNTPTSGIHVLATAAQNTRRYITHARGVLAAPAIGDDVFCCAALQKKYTAAGAAIVTAKMEFATPDATVGMNYGQHFGVLLHPWSSATAANTANTNANNGAASAAGGWLMYHIYSITGAGTVTISIDESATGVGAWSALSGATTGAIATASAPTAGLVQLSTTAAVKQYLRWQIAFGGSATACTFALSFMRG